MPRWTNGLQTKDEVHRLKREAVLRESGRIFSRRGFHNTSLADVAKHLDVSKGTLYNYVKDKQEILFEFHKMALEVGRRAMHLAQETEGTGADKLRIGIRSYIAMLNEELGGYGVISEIGALKPADRAEVIERRDRFEEQFVELFNAGIADGSLRPTDPKIAIFSFMGTLQSIPTWYSPEGRLSAADVADQITDLLMYGLAQKRRKKSNKPASRPKVTHDDDR